MRYLFYTFRTFPDELLYEFGQDVFKFGSLKSDLKRFQQVLHDKHPDLIVGFALSRTSRQESRAVNRFNRGIIDKDGPAFMDMPVLEATPFPLATRTTHTFCNWTMYKLSQSHDVAFFHTTKNDTGMLFDYFKQLLD